MPWMEHAQILLPSYELGRWDGAKGPLVELPSAIDGRIVALVPGGGLDYGGMVRYAREVGGPQLRRLTFHQRALLVRNLATYLNERRAELYALSFETGATKRDHFFDIDGGIGTLFSFASKARRELPNERFAVEGPVEPLSKQGTLCRASHPDAADRRRRPHQRVQLPVLGDA